MKNNFISNVVNLWKDIVSNTEQDKLEFQLNTYKKLFNIFQIGEYYYYIFNFSNMECEYQSSNVEKVLGYKHALTMREFLGMIHPEDTVHYLNFENAAINFLKGLPFEKLGKYKIQYDFRIRNAQGNYLRILHQAILIHFDENKNFYRSLALHTDISHIKKGGTPSLSFIGIDDEPSFIDIQAPPLFKGNKDSLFSKREKEILKLVLAGRTSDEIAAELFISVHTVNTHRKNIFSKSKARNMVELISMTIDNGWV